MFPESFVESTSIEHMNCAAIEITKEHAEITNELAGNIFDGHSRENGSLGRSGREFVKKVIATERGHLPFSCRVGDAGLSSN